MVSLCLKDLLKKIKTSQRISQIRSGTLERKDFGKTQDSKGASAWIQWGIILDEFAHVPALNPTKKSKPNRSQSEELTITQK
jgi:hypothetical protein